MVNSLHPRTLSWRVTLVNIVKSLSGPKVKDLYNFDLTFSIQFDSGNPFLQSN